MILQPRQRPPEGADALAWGCAIHRHLEPRQWPAAIEQAPAEHRAEVEVYLRGIAYRIKAQRRITAERKARGEARR